jgi:hypothetical protein
MQRYIMQLLLPLQLETLDHTITVKVGPDLPKRWCATFVGCEKDVKTRTKYWAKYTHNCADKEGVHCLLDLPMHCHHYDLYNKIIHLPL